MTRLNHTGGKNLDFWVDGHHVSGYTEADALAEARYLFNFEPQVIRPWTDEDQATLTAALIDEPVVLLSGPIAVVCPTCCAPAGKPCTTPTDTTRRDVSWFHLKREESLA